MRPRDPRRLLPATKGNIEDLQKQIDFLVMALRSLHEVNVQYSEAFSGQYQINKHLISELNRVKAQWN